MEHRLRIKVHEGTRSDVRLCDSCAKGQVTHSANGSIKIFCHAGFNDSITIHERVVKCSKYLDGRQQQGMDLTVMQEQAYILTEYGPLKTVGFVSPREYRKKHPDEDPLEVESAE